MTLNLFSSFNILILFGIVLVHTSSIVLAASPSSSSSYLPLCDFGVNLLEADTTLWTTTEDGTSDSSSSSNTSPFDWSITDHIGTLGDGIIFSGTRTSNSTTTTTSSDTATSTNTLKLFHSLSCALPIISDQLYDLELTVSAKRVQQPNHAYMRLTAQALDQDNSPLLPLLENDINNNEIVTASIDPMHTVHPFHMPYSNRITRAAVSSKTRSYRFTIEFNDIIVYSPKNHISAVLLLQTDSGEDRMLLLNDSLSLNSNAATDLLPSTLYSAQFNVPHGVSKEPLVTLHHLHWIAQPIPLHTFKDPIVTVLKGEEKGSEEEGLFDITVARDEKDQNGTTPYTIQSYHFFNKTLDFAPAILRMTADVSDIYHKEEEEENKEDVEAQQPPNILLELDLLSLDKDSPTPIYLGSKSQFWIPIFQGGTSSSTSSSTTAYRSIVWFIPIPPHPVGITLSVHFRGSKTHLAHIKNIKLQMISFQDTTASTKRTKSIIYICCLVVILASALILFTILCMRRRSRTIRMAANKTLIST